MREQGHYLNISNDDYHADKDYVSSSQIKLGLYPSLYKHVILDGKGEKKETSSMSLGTLTHTLLLEPEVFDDEYHVYDGTLTKTGLIPAKDKKLIAKEHPEKIIVSKNDYEFAALAKKNCEEYSHARKLLFSHDNVVSDYNESSYFLNDKEWDIDVRVRPDRIVFEKDRAYIVDVKTTRNPKLEDFKRDAIYKYHYDLSAWMYIDVVRKLTGFVCDFYWLIVGTDSSAPVAVYKVGEETLMHGRRKYIKAITNIKKGKERNEWKFQEQIEVI